MNELLLFLMQIYNAYGVFSEQWTVGHSDQTCCFCLILGGLSQPGCIKCLCTLIVGVTLKRQPSWSAFLVILTKLETKLDLILASHCATNTLPLYISTSAHQQRSHQLSVHFQPLFFCFFNIRDGVFVLTTWIAHPPD